MRISEHFTLEELISSSTATKNNIDNRPTADEQRKLIKLVNEILEPLRKEYGKPIIVTSGFRCSRLNFLVGGSKTSQHMKAEAVDIKAKDGNNKALFDVAKRMIDEKKIKVGQLIWEYGSKTNPQWVHISLPYSKVNNILYLYNK